LKETAFSQLCSAIKYVMRLRVPRKWSVFLDDAGTCGCATPGFIVD